MIEFFLEATMEQKSRLNFPTQEYREFSRNITQRNFWYLKVLKYVEDVKHETVQRNLNLPELLE